MKFRAFVQILADHGFTEQRQKGSHRIYVGAVGGRMRLVVVAVHNWNDEIKPGTLASMIRQSGLPKSLFR
jgi:predicted RNA binding protein YcfA (HicA-like mRNA interferase family)